MTLIQNRRSKTSGSAPSSVADGELVINQADGLLYYADAGGTVRSTPLQGNAPLASPAFTGTPTAPTPAAGDSSQKLATTGFVTANYATTAPAMNGTASAGSSKAAARSDHVHPTDTSRQAALGFTPVQQGTGVGQTGNAIKIGFSATGLKATVDATDFGTIWTDALGVKSFGANGYAKLPSGLIIQWGFSNAGTGDTTVTLPIAFPNTIVSALAVANIVNGSYPSTSMVCIAIDGANASSFILRPRFVLNGGTVGMASQYMNWIALGY